MVDLKKFRDQSKKMNLSELGVWLLRKFQTMHDELAHQLTVKTCHFARRAGHYKTLGGAATEDITISGVKASMKCMVQMHTEGAVPVTIVTAKCDKNKLTVEFSADPSTDHEIEYWIFT